MNWKRLAFWAVLFCGLLIYVVLFERHEQPRPAAVLPAETFARVLPLEAADITGLLVSDGEKTVRLSLRGKELRVVEPEGARVAPDIIASMLSAITEAVIVDEIEPGQDQAEYGLSPPAFTLQVQASAGAEPVTLLLGASAPSMINLYASLPQQNRTILLGTYLRFSLRTFLDNVKTE
ncbi:MAG: DUF4340 domain-containing protein [Deltaproteobacteria bacterium]|nr:DUF4340 domain-containing protein [Deltaproteobacteria bacterium]